MSFIISNQDLYFDKYTNKIFFEKNKNLDKDYVINGFMKNDVSFFLYENILIGNIDFIITITKKVHSINDSFHKFVKLCFLSFCAKDYEKSLCLANKSISIGIDSYNAKQDTFFRFFNTLFEFYPNHDTAMLVYNVLSSYLYFNKKYFIQPRIHAYLLKTKKFIHNNFNYFNGIIVENVNGHIVLNGSKHVNIRQNENIKLIATMRVRNEECFIEHAIKHISHHVDGIIVYDDHSNDHTLEILNDIRHKYNILSIIKNDDFTFNESMAYNKLREEGRRFGGTHFIQIDTDEVLSGNLLTSSFSLKKICTYMHPGDCLCVPWIQMKSKNTYIDGNKLYGRHPYMRGDFYKDIIYCDDGYKYQDNFIHVSSVPCRYNRRFIIFDKSYSLMHMEEISRFSLAIKKDWYRFFEFSNGKKNIFQNQTYDWTLEFSQSTQDHGIIDLGLDKYNFSLDEWKRVTDTRIQYNIISYCQIPIKNINELTHIDYEKLIKDFPNLLFSTNEHISIPNKHTSISQGRQNKSLQTRKKSHIINYLAPCADLFININNHISKSKNNILFSCVSLSTAKSIIDIIRDNEFNSNIIVFIYSKGASYNELLNIKKFLIKNLKNINIVVCKYIFNPDMIRKIKNKYFYLFLKKIIRLLINNIEIDTIFIPFLGNPPEKFLLEVYKKSKVCLYPDGLTSCVDLGIIDVKKSIDRPKSKGICNQHIKRIDMIYVNNTIPKIPNYTSNNIYNIKNGIMAPVNFTFINSEADKILNINNCAIILAQPLSRDQYCNTNDEIEIYNYIISKLKICYNNILFKPHPRDNHVYKIIEKQGIEIIDKNILISNCNIHNCCAVGFFSSSMFEINNINNKIYTCIDHDIFNNHIQIQSKIDREICNIVRMYIEPFSRFEKLIHTF